MFDKILLVNVLYFFDTDGRDIAEVYRVLRSGGRLVIYVTSREKWPFAGPETHRTFDARDLARLLEEAGFRQSHIIITHAELALGVKGFIAVAEKSRRSTRLDEETQDWARRSRLRGIEAPVSAERPNDQ
jgi:SAM-dependent methyltransferase